MVIERVRSLEISEATIGRVRYKHKKVIYVLATEKRRQIGTYEDAGTGENSYVVFQSMLKMLNNFFIHNDVPKYYKKSPLDSSVGFGNTPNSKMGKSLTKNWPRFLS